MRTAVAGLIRAGWSHRKVRGTTEEWIAFYGEKYRQRSAEPQGTVQGTTVNAVQEEQAAAQSAGEQAQTQADRAVQEMQRAIEENKRKKKEEAERRREEKKELVERKRAERKAKAAAKVSERRAREREKEDKERAQWEKWKQSIEDSRCTAYEDLKRQLAEVQKKLDAEKLESEVAVVQEADMGKEARTLSELQAYREWNESELRKLSAWVAGEINEVKSFVERMEKRVVAWAEKEFDNVDCGLSKALGRQRDKIEDIEWRLRNYHDP